MFLTALLRDPRGQAVTGLPLTLVVKRPDGVEYRRRQVEDQGAGGRAHSIPLLSGDLPSPKNPPSGCVFRTRCPQAESQCAQADMQLRAVGDGHLQACWKVKD